MRGVGWPEKITPEPRERLPVAWEYYLLTGLPGVIIVRGNLKK
jgi:hypothetical protein